QTALATGVSSNAVRQIVSDATKAELAPPPSNPQRPRRCPSRRVRRGQERRRLLVWTILICLLLELLLPKFTVKGTNSPIIQLYNSFYRSLKTKSALKAVHLRCVRS